MNYYVQLKLFASLVKTFSKSSKQIQIKPGTTIKELMDVMGIKPKEVKLIFVNGVAKQINSELKDGDRVGLFPPVGGG